MRNLTWLSNTRSLLSIWLGLVAIVALAGMGSWGLHQIRSNEQGELAVPRQEIRHDG